jgi:DNA-binding transcriptional MocR family regulator
MNPPLSRRVARLTSSLIRDILQVTQRPGVISFAGGLPAQELMPDLDFTGLADAGRQYGPSEGEPALRSLIAQNLSALGIPSDANHVLVTSGSQQGIDLVGKLFIDEGSPVMLEAPTYLATIQALGVYGAAFEGLSLAADGIDPDALRWAIVRRRPAFVYLIPTFQNPSGCCYSDAVRRAVAKVLDETGVPLIEDDPYRDLAYQPAGRTPICAYLQQAPWVYLGSFSKITAPGLRIGYLAASSSLFQGLVRLKQASDLHSNRPGQLWLARFLNSDEFEAHRERMVGVYRQRRDAMQAALLSHFAGLAQWRPPAGGLFFWLRLNQECDTLAALEAALARDVAFMPGEPLFPANSPSYPAIRLNFSHAAPEQIEQGIALLGELWGRPATGDTARHEPASASWM